MTTAADGAAPGGRSARITIAHHGLGMRPLRCGNLTRLMTAVGHFRRFEAVGDESGLPPTPDVSRNAANRHFGPRADICSAANAAHA
jgi:hypothetical protein